MSRTDTTWPLRQSMLAMACCCMLVAAATSVRAQVINDSLEISRVEIDGNAQFTDAVLASAIVTASTRCNAVAPLCWIGVGRDPQYLDQLQLEWDKIRLELFYYREGFREAEATVDTVRKGRTIEVTFRITEGAPVRVGSLRVDGADSVPRDVTRSLPLAVGDPLSLVQHDAARDSMVARLQNRGYAYADGLANYDISADSPYVAHVFYEIIPGPIAQFGPIDIVGAEQVDSAVVRRMLTFEPGDLFTLEELRNSQRNLFAQEVFRHAEVRPVMAAEPTSIVPVRVQVNEGNLHRVRAGLGASTQEYVNVEGRWIARSFLGGARRLELRARASNLFATMLPDLPLFQPTDAFYAKLSGLLSADFTQPWFFGPVNTLGMGVFAERRSIPDVFVRTSGGGYLTFSRTLGPGRSISTGYRPELTKLEAKEGDFIFCIGFTACGPDEIRALTELRWLAPVGVTFAQDRANSIFAPTRGYSIRIDAEVADALTGSDFGYTRVAAELTDYHSFGNGIISALRVKPGWTRELNSTSALGVHPQKRFFAGGANSVRGFAQYRLGPKLLIANAVDQLLPPAEAGGAGCSVAGVNDGSCDAGLLAGDDPNAFRVQPVGGGVALEGNIEARFPVYGANLRGAAFVDFGQVWESHRSVNVADVVWTPGFGVRYFSPIGPIRVDVGYYAGRGETLTVVTTEVGLRSTESNQCLTIGPDDEIDPDRLCNTEVLQALRDPVLWSPRQSFFDRLQFHFSIGQAF